MIEAAVVLSLDMRPLYWHEPSNRTTVALPDSQRLWEVLWDNRQNLYGVAHTHPGDGIPGPSYEDLSTFAALEASLGLRLHWPIATRTAAVLCTHKGPRKLSYEAKRVGMGSTWVYELLKRSGYLIDDLQYLVRSEEYAAQPANTRL